MAFHPPMPFVSTDGKLETIKIAWKHPSFPVYRYVTTVCKDKTSLSKYVFDKSHRYKARMEIWWHTKQVCVNVLDEPFPSLYSAVIKLEAENYTFTKTIDRVTKYQLFTHWVPTMEGEFINLSAVIEVTILCGREHPLYKATPAAGHLNSVLRSVSLLGECDETFDFFFIVDGTPLGVNKAFMMNASPILYSEIANKTSISVKDVSAREFSEFLNCVYKGQCSTKIETCQIVFKLAFRYGIHWILDHILPTLLGGLLEFCDCDQPVMKCFVHSKQILFTHTSWMSYCENDIHLAAVLLTWAYNMADEEAPC